MKVFGVGEVLFDVCFSQNQIVGGSVGGSVLNALSTLASLGYSVNLMSEVGDDELGLLIEKQIMAKNINCQLFKVKSKKTSLALAFLTESGDADYSFYKSYWFPGFNQVLCEEGVEAGDIILFGSLFSIHEGSHTWLCKELDRLKGSKTILLYDPNLRKGYLEEFNLDDLKQRVEACMERASLVKASIEDLTMLWGELTPKEYYGIVKDYCSYLILTCGESGLFFFSPSFTTKVSAVHCDNVVSTIGAGDNLSAGVVFGLIDVGKSRLDILTNEEWLSILKKGTEFGAAVCRIQESSLTKSQIMNLS